MRIEDLEVVDLADFDLHVLYRKKYCSHID